MTDFTSKVFRETYRDYYDKEDGYHRVLYNAGRALQARELTEAQRIIHEEIARFGQNIFKEGAMVNPGGATVDNGLEYIRLASPTSEYDESIIGQTLTNGTIKFKVLEMYDVDPDGNDPITIYVQYTDTLGIQNASSAPRVSPGDVLTYDSGAISPNMIVAQDLPVIEDDGSLTVITGAGKATKAYFASGDFFVQGHFVYLSGGTTFIDKYSGTPTVDFGFRVEQNIVTESEDENLHDNQGEVPNLTSPGAHRYQIKLTPTVRPENNTTEENFVFVARIVNGVITREISTFDAYNRINDLLALRTKEESGDYVVKEFKAIFEDLPDDDTSLNLDVTEGVAYVDGYRLEVGTTDIVVPKARETRTQLQEAVPAVYGNWIYIDPDRTQGFGDLSVFGGVNLVSADGTTVGGCHIRGVGQDAIGYRLYIFDVKMNPIATGSNVRYPFSDVVKLVDGTSTGTNEIPLRPLTFDTDSDQTPLTFDTTLYGTSNNDLLFALPFKSPKKDSIENVTYTAQRFGEFSLDQNDEIVLEGVESQSWIIAEVGGPIIPIVPSDNSDGTSTYADPLLDNTKTYAVAYFDNIQTGPKTKTSVVGEKTVNLTSDIYETRPVILDVVDAISIDKVELFVPGVTDPEDITYQWYLDNGQRDNYYGISVAHLKEGYTLPYDDQTSGHQIKITYSYFQRTGGGKFFAASSYTGLTYEEIPNHTTLSTGESISLRDVLDFRPDRFTGFPYDFTISELPQNASSIIINQLEYYLPRTDILVVNATDSRGDTGFGELQVVRGQPAIDPREPETPAGSLPLYKFALNAYTIDRSDVISTFIPNKRFTMKDIAKLSDRVETLYELTALSFLETNTNVLQVLDANGNNRTKAGFIADNFSTLNFCDVHNPAYRASVDPEGLLRPSFVENSIRLAYDATDTNNVVSKKGDIITLPHTDVVMVSQLLATGTDNINPFAVITQNGFMTLSPASDEWVETKRLPDIMQNVVRRISTYLPTFFSRPNARIRSKVESRTIQEFIGERILDIEIIPFMRSRKISFRVQGLRPNTRMFAYFGNKDVSDWVRPESTYTNFSDNPTEYGNQYANETEYPAALGGKGDLVTDDKGELIGSFFLPNTSDISFRTGRQEFKLLDISVNNDEGSTSVSRAGYTSVGTIETVQRTIRTTREIETTYWRDPLAQTFFVDQVENPNGLFLTRARVYVESKDSVIPMQVQIRPVENGVPTNRVIPGSSKFISPSNIPVTPLTDQTDIQEVRDNPTVIEFDEPVYLTPGEEYAIVLLAESVDYNVYTAQTYEFVLGPSREARVSRQPTLGSLFMSQNGSTWTPDQTKDLMFELDRAEFSISGQLILENTELPRVTLTPTPFETTSGSNVVFVYHQGHGFTHGDIVKFSNVSGTVGGIASTAFENASGFILENPTWEGYTIRVVDGNGSAINASSSSLGGGNNVIATQQVMYDQYLPQIQSFSPNASSINATVTKTVGSSYGSGRTTSTLGYNVTETESVSLNDLNVNVFPNVIANSDNYPAETLKFTLSMSTGDRKVSPVIDLQRVSVVTLENVINDVDPETSGNGTDVSYATQHITTPVIIDELSEGLKIIFAANRARGASFEVFARTSLDENEFAETGWTLIDIETPMPTDENPDIFRDYEYTLDADPFTVFQVMIVMKSSNSSKSPMITDLRAISLITSSGLNLRGRPADWIELNPETTAMPEPEPDPSESVADPGSDSDGTTPADSDGTTPSDSDGTTPSDSDGTTPSDSDGTTPGPTFEYSKDTSPEYHFDIYHIFVGQGDPAYIPSLMWNDTNITYTLTDYTGMDLAELTSIDANDGYTYIRGNLIETSSPNNQTIWHYEIRRELTNPQPTEDTTSGDTTSGGGDSTGSDSSDGTDVSHH